MNGVRNFLAFTVFIDPYKEDQQLHFALSMWPSSVHLSLINVSSDQYRTTAKVNCEVQQPEVELNSLPQVVAFCQHPCYSCVT
jgi:hypothetical protein